MLGLFFLVEGLSAVISAGIDASLFGTDWQTRAGQLSAGLVFALAGGVLVFFPAEVTERLHGRNA